MADLPHFIPDRDKLTHRHGFLTAVVTYLDRILSQDGPDPAGPADHVPLSQAMLAEARDKAKLEIQNIERVLTIAHFQAERAQEEYIQGGAVL